MREKHPVTGFDQNYKFKKIRTFLPRNKIYSYLAQRSARILKVPKAFQICSLPQKGIDVPVCLSSFLRCEEIWTPELSQTN